MKSSTNSRRGPGLRKLQANQNRGAQAAAQQKESVAIPFISYTTEAGFEINQEAVDFLVSVKQSIGIISVCGKYRTGKSYLLNKLFLEQIQASTGMTDMRKEGFSVGPTINPCTKGLWLLKEIFYSPNDPNKEMPIILIDTEGLGAFDEEENHDAKIFLLALLLCSLLLYNSIGSIDENALQNLSLVVNLSKKLQVREGQQMDPDEMAAYFPTFLWVLRDFALQLRDTDGNEINQKTYLENSLREVKGSSDAVEEKNRIRRLIRHFFQERDCFTVVRPVEDERLLQNLAAVPEEMVREEFTSQIDFLRAKSLKKVRPKTIKGKPINGPMLVQLAQSYIQALNEGEVPTIDLAWDNVQMAELQRAYDDAMLEFNERIKAEFQQLPISEETMKVLVRELKDQAMATFKSGVLSGSDFLNTPKGEDFLTRLEREQGTLISQVQLKNRKFLSKELFDAIQKQVDSEIKPKINAMLQNLGAGSGAEPGSPTSPSSERYEFRDLKRDLESIQEQYQEDYPAELVYQKLFDVTFQMSELLSFVNKQVSQNAEMFSQARLKQVEADYAELKKESVEERDRTRDVRHEQETALIKAESQIAILNEKLLSAQREAAAKPAQRASTDQQQHQSNEEAIALREQLKQRDQIIRRLKEEAQEKLSITREEVTQVASSDLIAKQNECESLKQQIEVLHSKLATTDEKLRQEKTKVKEVIQAQRDVRKSINASSSKRDADLSSPGKLDHGLSMPSSASKNRKATKVGASRSLVDENIALDYAEMLSENERLRNEKLELENSNLILRKFKKIYQQTLQVQCSGCRETFEPLAFKGHVLNCRYLESVNAESSPAQQQDLDGQKMIVKASQVDHEGYVKFLLSYCGISWYTQVKLEEVQYVVRQLRQNFPNLSSFAQRDSKCEAFLGLDSYSLNSPVGLELVNTFVQDLSRFEVVRNDLSFRILLQVNEKLEEDQKRQGKYQGTNSVSLLRIAKQNGQQVA